MAEVIPDQTWEQRQKTGFLIALRNTGKHVYPGTVDGVEKAKRRAKNKVARKSRRVNRG